jgi:hypothetical protein
MGTATRPAKTFAGLWDAFADVDVFVDEVMAELAAMAKEGSRPIDRGQSQPWPERCCARPSWRSGVFVSVACSGGPLDSCATSPLAHLAEHSACNGRLRRLMFRKDVPK